MSDTQSHDNEELKKLYRDLIVGSHILHYHNVLDAFGHLSFRHPSKPHIFVMSRNMAPATITSHEDLIEYLVDNAEPVKPDVAPGFLERCIHSECYKRYPAVKSVVHSHSEAVVPYTFSGVPLRACYHMAGFLGTEVPVWNIADTRSQDDPCDLLVRNTRIGSSLAMAFEMGNASTDVSHHAVVLMRGHGFTVVAENIQDCVMRAIYTQKNAAIQTTALITRSAALDVKTAITYLSEEEGKATASLASATAARPWNLWVREVESCNLYTNLA